MVTLPAVDLPKPHIVLVHGAFADGSCWTPVVRILQKDGYTVEAVQNEMRSLAADVANTRARIVAQNAPTLVVGHSYGGAVISGAATGAPNAVGLVYLTALVVDKGESFASLTTGSPPSDGAKAKVTETDAGHAAMIAKPAEVAKLIETAAEAVAK